jgi:hypothetical protein
VSHARQATGRFIDDFAWNVFGGGAKNLATPLMAALTS